MTGPSISNAGQSLSGADIERLERALGTRLPDEYKAFLLRHNGGGPEPDRFGAAAPWGGSVLDFFLRVDGGQYDDLLQVNARLEPPPGLVAVASDAGGNYVCVATDDARRGEVHFWAIDEGGETFKIASTFTEFLASFGEAPAERPAAPAPAPVPSLDECRQDLERAWAILRGHQEQQAAEDRIVDALLQVAADAANAIIDHGPAGANLDLVAGLRRVAEKHAWIRGRRSTPPSPVPLEDVADHRAQDDAIMKAITEHHISETIADDRIRELLTLLDAARDALVEPGEGNDRGLVTSLDIAYAQALDWLATPPMKRGRHA
jgi:hypothetical protein